MNLSQGQKIEVIVTKSETFGLFAKYSEYEVIVLIPETSWIASFNSCKQFASINDIFIIKIINVDAKKKQIHGSIKQVHENPWEKDLLKEGAIVDVKVLKYVDCSDRCNGNAGYLVELFPGAYAMLCNVENNLVEGNYCNVKITKVNPENKSVAIELT